MSAIGRIWENIVVTEEDMAAYRQACIEFWKSESFTADARFDVNGRDLSPAEIAEEMRKRTETGNGFLYVYVRSEKAKTRLAEHKANCIAYWRSSSDGDEATMVMGGRTLTGADIADEIESGTRLGQIALDDWVKEHEHPIIGQAAPAADTPEPDGLS